MNDFITRLFAEMAELISVISTKLNWLYNNKIDVSQKGVANGVATLDGNAKIPVTQLPPLAIKETFVVGSQAAMLALTAQQGDAAIRTDISKTFFLVQEPASVLANWQEVLTPTDGVTSVGLSAPVGFNVSNTPITSSGVLGLSYAPGYSLPTNAKQTQWDTAYQHSVDMGSATVGIPDWSTDLENQVNF